jgi:hypothetical protein
MIDVAVQRQVHSENELRHADLSTLSLAGQFEMRMRNDAEIIADLPEKENGVGAHFLPTLCSAASELAYQPVS